MTDRWTEEDAAELARLEVVFEEAGGRGVELAEQIDYLRAKRDYDHYSSREVIEALFDGFDEFYMTAELGDIFAYQDGNACTVVIPGGRKFLVYAKEVDE